jgi:hypothetical protein
MYTIIWGIQGFQNINEIKSPFGDISIKIGYFFLKKTNIEAKPNNMKNLLSIL